jgi:hypothetical protein
MNILEARHLTQYLHQRRSIGSLPTERKLAPLQFEILQGRIVRERLGEFV